MTLKKNIISIIGVKVCVGEETTYESQKTSRNPIMKGISYHKRSRRIIDIRSMCEKLILITA